MCGSLCGGQRTTAGLFTSERPCPLLRENRPLSETPQGGQAEWPEGVRDLPASVSPVLQLVCLCMCVHAHVFLKQLMLTWVTIARHVSKTLVGEGLGSGLCQPAVGNGHLLSHC